VLDEPSVGLHPRDSARLLNTLRTLVHRGNSVLVVEHDLETIRAADWVVDLGPGAGVHGGRVVGFGTPADLATQPDSITGPYLAGTRSVGIPAARRDAKGAIKVRGARLHNLRNVSVELPLGCMVGITGVSGSGKSSLILGTVVPHVRARLQNLPPPAAPIDAIEGVELIERLVAVDARPLGRTPRSSPATYMGVFALLRDVFSQVPEARARGFKPATLPASSLPIKTAAAPSTMPDELPA
jgi:excinuclease ABC subunit A